MVFPYELLPKTCAIVIFMCELVYTLNKPNGSESYRQSSFVFLDEPQVPFRLYTLLRHWSMEPCRR